MRHLTLLLFLAVALAGCGEDPFRIRWSASPREDVLYSIDRNELNTPSAFDMITRSRVVLEDPQTEGAWDFALDRAEGEMYLVPPNLLGLSSRAAIAPIPGTEFDDVREAPADTAVFIRNDLVKVSLGTVYVIRSRQQATGFGACVFYGKLEPLSIDPEAGTVRFLHDSSPDCNNRSLVPTDD